VHVDHPRARFEAAPRAASSVWRVRTGAGHDEPIRRGVRHHAA
jgi:hypothetical protein